MIQIKLDESINSNNAKILLNGENITSKLYVRKLTIVLEAGHAPLLKIESYAQNLDLSFLPEQVTIVPVEEIKTEEDDDTLCL